MKLFWKNFLEILILVMFSLTLFGSVLLYSTFQDSMNREEEQARKSLQMYQYSFLQSLLALPEDYKMIDVTVADLVQKMEQNFDENETVLQVFNQDKVQIYQSREFSSNLMEYEERLDNGMQKTAEINGDHYLENIVKVESKFGTFYLETDQNIESIYHQQEELYQRYRTILVFVFAVTVIFSATISLRITIPIRQLSTTTVEFAKGNYGLRAPVKGKDEITDLIRSFNQMADRLESNIIELKEAARRQEEFTEAFSHELKTPLTSIMGYSEALSSMDLTKEEQNSSARYIYEQGKRLESLSLKMMELTGVLKQDWKFKVIDVPLLAQHVKNMTEQICNQKNVQVEVLCEQGEMEGDFEVMESLLCNLIDNARKASHENATIQLIGRKLKIGYQICVKDHGCGIPEEEIGKIHEAFYMVDKSRARKEGGAGIGMALCERILTLHHGTWSIESKIGEGTTIYMNFPEMNETVLDHEGKKELEFREKERKHETE